MIAKRLRRSRSPIVEVFKPSMLREALAQNLEFLGMGNRLGPCASYLMLPEVGSMIRNSERVSDDFPAPVLPTTPIFSFALMSRFTSLSTRSSPSRYFVGVIFDRDLAMCGPADVRPFFEDDIRGFARKIRVFEDSFNRDNVSLDFYSLSNNPIKRLRDLQGI